VDDQHKIPRTYIKEVPDAYTARHSSPTDVVDNRSPAFHPGAMGNAHEQNIPRSASSASFSGRSRGHAPARRAVPRRWFPSVDRAGSADCSAGEELKLRFIELAGLVAVNDYDRRCWRNKTGTPHIRFGGRVKALIVTWGSKGSVIYSQSPPRGHRDGQGRAVVDPPAAVTPSAPACSMG